MIILLAGCGTVPENKPGGFTSGGPGSPGGGADRSCANHEIIPNGCGSGLTRVTLCRGAVLTGGFCASPSQLFGAQCKEDQFVAGGCAPSEYLVIPCVNNILVDNTYCTAGGLTRSDGGAPGQDGQSPPDFGEPDASPGPDIQPPEDIGRTDAGGMDAEQDSGGDPDAGPDDLGSDDPTSHDTGLPDGGLADTGVPDAGDDTPPPPGCVQDRVTPNGCPGGDLHTRCESGRYTTSECRKRQVDLEGLYAKCRQLRDGALLACLRDLVSGHRALGYDNAKEKLFGVVNNDNGWVECVYTGRRIQTRTEPGSSNMNTEHSWPQSKGADDEPARSDLNHLYPTDSGTNSRRSNYPFCEVVNSSWTGGGSKLGSSSNGTKCFEPRDVHKGDLARSMFYFSVRYNMKIDGEQEAFFRRWNKADPPSEWEKGRHERVFQLQDRRNPFVDIPDLPDLIGDF
ncbi:MAG: hypothetical protein GMKNLPBB_01877 [Myxococcota bacterium]|nr:hypothetical protein [Myxococcota bacterium]